MTAIDKSYYTILESLKEKIRIARQKAILAVSKEMLIVYWEIGYVILQKQEDEGWGTRVIDRLVSDLRIEFPDMKGLSARNFRYMRTFADAWPKFGQQAAAQLQFNDSQSDIIGQQAAAQLPWGHHQVILDKAKTPEERNFYTKKAVENGWSRNILVQNIQSQLHLRQGQAITNFSHTLPPAQSDMATEALKNPYIFDFLSMTEEMKERDLEKALIQHIKKFMLELGRGFTYVGNQFNLKVEGDEYFLDLLFFNYHLDRFVVFELKIGEFKPEHAGKLNFYINTINEKVKMQQHKPTIGVLLCKTPNKTVVKYALQGIDAPMGVAEYELINMLPKQLTSEMPTIEELEHELEKEIETIQPAIDQKRAKLKRILNKFKGEEIKKAKDHNEIKYLFEKVLMPVHQKIQEILNDEIGLFAKKEINIRINNTTNSYYTLLDLEARIYKNESIWVLGLAVYLDGFKPAGTKTFGLMKELLIETGEYKYQLKIDNGKICKEYLYHHQWTDEEVLQIAEQWSELMIDEINTRLESIS